MPDIRDYNLNRWGFVDDSGTLITIASSNVSIDELNSILGTINIVPNDDNYVLMVNGREAGVISITSQLKLKNVVYNPDTQSIEFTFESDEGEKKVSVDVHELVDVYTAGQGLGVDKNQFFIKIDPSSEKYLSVSENGIKISGLDTLLKNLNETLANFGQETAKAFDQINNVLETSINTINGGIDNEIRPAITKNEESITALQEKVDGIVVPTKVSELENDAQYQNADEVDAKISAHIQEAEDKFATKDELTEETNARTVKDTQLQNDLQLEAETARAAEKANADAISAINEVLPTKVEYTDVATSENPGRKAIVLKNHDVILGTTTTGQTNSLVMISKWDKADFGSASVTLNLNGKDEHPTYNDNKEIAFVDDIPSVEGFVTKEIADETYQPKGDYATLEALNAEITTRSEVDTELQSDITAEATARIQKDNEIEASLQNKADKADLDTINLVKKEDLVYELQVGDRVAGSINLPEDQFLKGVDYNSDTKVITFTFETTDGEVISQVDISDLVDTYVAGNGLNLTSNEFSIKIDATTQQYVEVSAEGLKIINIDEKLAEKVGLVDIATEENPNRKAIVLKNHDTILGTTTEGATQNLIMMSKWNKVDVGTASNELNLNGSEERPTYNDNEEIALMKDIEEIKLPIEFNFPIRTLQDKVYTQEEIFAWFGVADAAELKGLIVREGQFYLKYGIQLSGNPYYYKMPIQYIAFESANQIKMVVIGLDTTNDMPTKYEIILNLDGTVAEGNSNIKVTSNDLASATDMPSLDGYATEEWVNTQGFLKEHQDISNLATKDEVALKANQSDVDSQVNALNERIDAIKIPTKVSELENDAQYQTSSEVDARIQAVVGAAPEALDTLEEIANKLSDNDDVVASLTTQIAEKATTEALNAEIEARSEKDTELQGNIEAEAQARIAKDTEIETELANKVAYTDVTTEENPNRKAIVLNNHDTLLGNTTSGSAVNIAMVSKWDKVDLGSTQVSINLNGKDERPTYNDDVELALLSDVEAVTVPTKVSELENDSLYQTKDEVDAAIATKAEQADIDEIKADLEQFKAPYEIDLNALNSAGDADSEAISTAIGGIDNLRAVISENRSVIGDINNGTVPVSIRILGNITTVYYVLDSLAGYTLNEINIQNTSGTLAKNSVTHSVMSEEMVVDNLTSDEATLPLSAKQGKVLDGKIQKKGMYYQGVKVDTRKLFALTKESSEEDIKAALQLETSSGSYTLPTAEILDDCLGKGYQLLSNWMPVSVAWNGAAYVLYIVGQNYMMQPTGLYTVSIKITDGVYSVFQAAKVEEFAIISKINTQIESLYQTVNDLKSNIPILSAKVELLESKVDNLEKSNSEVVETYDGSQELNDEAKAYSISNANITNSPSITAKSVILNDSTLTNNARMRIKAENVNINNLQVTGDFPKSTSNSVININDTENIIFKDMTFNSSNVYNGIEIGLSSDNSKLPKNIIFDNCRFEGSFSNNAILIFGTQNNATITLNNCYFERISNALRLSNKSNASGVTVNIINCTVDEWDSNPLWSGFLICEDYTNTESEAQAEEANLFSPEKIKVNFINLIHNGEKILPSDIVSVCGSKDENQVVVVCIDAIQGDYCINYDANKFPTITFE